MRIVAKTGKSGLTAGKGFTISRASLPELEGTPKQVAWAEDLRENEIKSFELMARQYVETGVGFDYEPQKMYGDILVAFAPTIGNDSARMESIEFQKHAARMTRFPKEVRAKLTQQEYEIQKKAARKKVAIEATEKFQSFLSSDRARSAARWIDSRYGRQYKFYENVAKNAQDRAKNKK